MIVTRGKTTLKHRSGARLGATVAVLSLLAGLCSCRGDATADESDGTRPTPVADSAVASAVASVLKSPTTTEAEDLPRPVAAQAQASPDGGIHLDAGSVSVDAPAGTLSAGTTVAVTAAGDLPQLPEWIEPAGTAAEIAVEGRFDGPLALSFAAKVPARVGPADIPVVLHLNPFGTWDIEAADLSADGAITITADTFSVRMPAWLRTAGRTAAEIVDFVSDEIVTGRSDPLGCQPEGDNDPATVAVPSWADLTAMPSGEVHTCLIGNTAPSGDIRAEVQIKSNRPAYLLVRLPPGADYVWVEGQGDFVPNLLSHMYGNLIGDRILLAPGKTMTAGYNRPPGNTQLDFNVETNTLTLFLSLVKELLGAYSDDKAMLLATLCAKDLDVASQTPNVDQVSAAALSCAKLAAEELDGALVTTGRELIASGKVRSEQFDRVAGGLKNLKRLAAITKLIDLGTFVVRVGAMAGNEALAFNPDVRRSTLYLTGNTPPAQAPGWDELAGATIPEQCGHPPTTLVDGVNVTLTEREGIFKLERTLRNGSSALATIDNPTLPVTAIVATCNRGGVGWPHQLLLFGPGAAFIASDDLRTYDWESLSMYGPARSGIQSITAADGKLHIELVVQTLKDPACCPSRQATVVVKADSNGLTVETVQLR